MWHKATDETLCGWHKCVLIIIEGEDEWTLIMQHLPSHLFIIRPLECLFNGFCVDATSSTARFVPKERLAVWTYVASTSYNLINSSKSRVCLHISEATSQCTRQSVPDGNKHGNFRHQSFVWKFHPFMPVTWATAQQVDQLGELYPWKFVQLHCSSALLLSTRWLSVLPQSTPPRF